MLQIPPLLISGLGQETQIHYFLQQLLPIYDLTPCWSPDGKQIVFLAVRGEGSYLYTMNADGTNEMRLPFVQGDESSPAWLPTP